MKIASIAEVKSRFSAYVKESGRGPVVVTRNGKPVAVLLGMEDEDELERLLLAHSPQFQAIMQTAQEQLQRGEGIPHDEFWQGVERDNAKPTKRSVKKRV